MYSYFHFRFVSVFVVYFSFIHPRRQFKVNSRMRQKSTLLIKRITTEGEKMGFWCSSCLHLSSPLLQFAPSRLGVCAVRTVCSSVDEKVVISRTAHGTAFTFVCDCLLRTRN